MKAPRLTLLLMASIILGAASCARAWDRPFGEADRDQIIAKQLSNRTLDRVEGIWLSDDQEYEIAIVKNRTENHKEYGYLGVILKSQTHRYHCGDLKCLLKATASNQAFPGTWFMRDKRSEDVFFVMTNENALAFRLPKSYTTYLVRLPLKEQGPVAATGYSMGTGFLVSKDLVATNYHVVAGHGKLAVTLAEGKKLTAALAMYDEANDLALLRLPEGVSAPALPLGHASSVKGGAEVYTVGFPLPTDLGTNAKIGAGIVNSLTGFGDDPRMYQISIPVQPGNSGGPLLDNQGRVVGVVTASLDNVYAFQHSGAIPQNVNFAMKVGYLAGLLDTLPSGVELTAARPPTKS